LVFLLLQGVQICDPVENSQIGVVLGIFLGVMAEVKAFGHVNAGTNPSRKILIVDSSVVLAVLVTD